MKTAQVDPSAYLMRLDPHDDIVATIEALCLDKQIQNAAIWGIGSVQDPTLAHYRIDHKKYSERSFAGIFEIVSLTGNVAVFEDQPSLHLHAVISDESMQAFGGHLVKGVCSATCELLIRDLGTKYEKQLNAEVGLKTWDFSDFRKDPGSSPG